MRERAAVLTAETNRTAASVLPANRRRPLVAAIPVLMCGVGMFFPWWTPRCPPDRACDAFFAGTVGWDYGWSGVAALSLVAAGWAAGLRREGRVLAVLAGVAALALFAPTFYSESFEALAGLDESVAKRGVGIALMAAGVVVAVAWSVMRAFGGRADLGNRAK